MHKLYSSNLNDIEKQNLRIEVLNQFKNCSLKPSEFCKLYGIKLNDFYNWRKRISNKNTETDKITPKFKIV